MLAIAANDPSSSLTTVIGAWRARPASAAAEPAIWPLAAFVSFLHVKPSHAISNIALLAWFGTLAERRVGHVTFLVFALLSGMLTSLAELAITAHGKIGASGIVFAAGALVVTTSREPPPMPRRLATAVIATLAIAFAYGLVISTPADPTGVVAHAGGLVCGGASGAIHARSIRSTVETR